MSRIAGVRRLFRFPWRTPTQVQADVDDELAFHLDQRATDLIAQGLGAAAAHVQARREFGDVERARRRLHAADMAHERVVDRRDRFDTLRRDVRHAVRALWRTPVFTVTAILSLALGMGANSAFFRVADALLLRALPVQSPEQLVVLARNPAQPKPGYTYPEYVRVRDHSAPLTGVTAAASGSVPVSLRMAPSTGSADVGPAETGRVALVAANYFGVLGVAPAAGRVLTADDDRVPGASAVAVLGYDFWQRRFGGRADAVGSRVRLNSTTFTVVGISAPGFTGAAVGDAPDLFVPLSMESTVTSVPARRWNAPDRAWLVVTARRRAGASTAQIAADVGARLAEAAREVVDPPSSAVGAHERTLDAHAVVLPGGRGTSIFREQVARPLVVVWAGAALVLLIACANVAGLSFARALTRERETATRLALGATRSRLVRQGLVEGALLSLAAGALGMVIATWGAWGLVRLLPQPGTPLVLDLSPDLRVFGFSLVVSIGAVVLFGLAPALHASRPDLLPALKREATAMTRGRRLDPRSALVVVQVALSVVLLVGAGLFVRTLDTLRSLDAGFAPERVLAVSVRPEQMGYADGPRLGAYYQQLRDRVAELPGVRSVSLADEIPLDGRRWTDDVTAAGAGPGDIYRTADLDAVGPGYFATLGIRLLAGRDFRNDDVSRAESGIATAPQAAVLSAAAARRLFPGQSPLGRRFARIGDAAVSYEVVGIVDDARYAGLREAPTGMIYFPFGGGRGTTLVVRTVDRPAALVASVRRAAVALDASVPVMEARPLAAQVDEHLAAERLLAALCSSFGALAALLAAVGLYGVLAESVLRRTRELGIRLALGASRADVVGSVVRGALWLVLPGALAGGLVAAGLAQLVARLLYGVGAADLTSIALAGGALLVVALGAAAAPARRAARLDPVSALRQD